MLKIPFKLTLLLSGAALTFASGAQSELQVTKTLEQSAATPAQYCVIFDADLKESPDLKRYADLYHNGKKADFALQIDNRQLCFGPLAHGESYELFLKPGLAAVNGEMLEAEYRKSFTLADAPSYLALERGQIITPEREDEILVIARNLEEAQLYLFRLSPEHLTAMSFAEYLENSPQPAYLMRNIAADHGFLLKKLPLKFKNRRNSEENLLVKLSDLGENLENGLYYLILADKSLEFDPQKPETLAKLYSSSANGHLSAKLLIKSDLSVTAFQSASGLDLVVRSFKDAKPQRGVCLTLLSKSAEVLGTAQTDREGRAHFNPELLHGSLANAPAYLIASSDDDFFALDLEQSPLYLEGVTQSQRADRLPLIFMDRTLLRPEETLHYSAYMRDLKGQALTGETYILKVRSPNGSVIETFELKDSGQGRYAIDYPIPKNAVFGRFALELCDLQEKVLDTSYLEIRSYVPQRIFTSLKEIAPLSYVLEGVFGFGAPAADLAVEASLRTSPDPHPFQDLANYYFGPSQTAAQSLVRERMLEGGRTAENGTLTIKLNPEESSYPQSAQLRASLFDANGQSVSAVQGFKLKSAGALPGVRRLDKDGLVFNPILADPEGRLLSGTVSWTLERIIRDYQYVLKDGRWDFREVAVSRPAGAGEIEVAAVNPDKALISYQGEDGDYLLTLSFEGRQTAFETSLGYASAVNPNSPESIKLTLNNKTLKKGKDFTLAFDSPFAGEGLILIGREEVSHLKSFEVKKGYNQIRLDYDAAYFPQSSALVAIYDGSGVKSPGAKRLLGIIPLSFDKEGRDLDFKVSLPVFAEAGTELEVPIEVSGTSEDVSVEAFLVDEGLLAINGYQSPDPLKVLFNEKLFGIRILDNYRFLSAPLERGQGYGADAEMSAMAKALGTPALSALSQKSAALRLPPVVLKDGEGVLRFEVPKFSGKMRLTLIAASKSAIDREVLPLTVKEKVIVSENLPLYLRAGDTLETHVKVTASDPKLTSGTLRVSCRGALKCEAQSALNLKINEMQAVPLAITALDDPDLNTGEVTLSFESAAYQDKKNVTLAVLPTESLALLSKTAYLKPGEKATFSFKENFKTLTAQSAVLSAVPGISSDLIEERLENPYAFTILDKAALLKLYLTLNKGDELIDSALVDVELRHLAASSFGAGWNDYERAASLYALDALLAANEQGFNVSLELLNSALDATAQSAAYGTALERALSAQVLSRAGKPYELSALSYLLDEEEILNAQALSVLSGIFTKAGDLDRAREALTLGAKRLEEHQKLLLEYARAKSRDEQLRLANLLAPYEESALNAVEFETLSLLRQALALEDDALTLELGEKLAALDLSYLSLTALAEAADLGVNLDDVESFSFDPKALSFEVNNTTQKPLFAAAQAAGFLKEKKQPNSAFLNFSKEYYRLDGTKLKLPTVLQGNEAIVVKLSLKHSLPLKEKILISDLLPAGMSYAGDLRSYPGDKSAFNLDELPYTEPIVGDDRLLLSFSYQDRLTYCYVLRAAFTGEFAAPAAAVQSLTNTREQSAVSAQPAAFTVK